MRLWSINNPVRSVGESSGVIVDRCSVNGGTRVFWNSELKKRCQRNRKGGAQQMEVHGNYK